MWCACVCMLSHFSCVQLLVTQWAIAHQAPLSILFSRQKYCHAFLQGIFRIQGSSLHLFQLLLCRWILYHWVTKKEEGNDSPFLPGKIPWTEEPGRLQSMGLRRVGHDWATSLSLFTFMHWRRKWQPTPVFLPGELQGWGSLVGCRLWGRTELDTTEAT